MKTMIKILISTVVVFVLKSTMVLGQKIDEERMDRDIEVSENVLSTLLHQQFNKQRMFFPMQVKGNYQPGYGVTFRLPADSTTPIIFSFDRNDNDDFVIFNEPAMHGEPPVPGEPAVPPAPGGEKGYSYSYKIENHGEDGDRDEDRASRESRIVHKEMRGNARVDHQVKIDKQSIVLKDKSGKHIAKFKDGKTTNLDSVREVYNNKVIEAAKIFLADYSDLIGQLAPSEKIVVTNQGEQPRRWVNKFTNAPNRTRLSVEAQRSDVSLYRQGKMTRDQLFSKIVVLNTKAVDTVEPDLELLSSIFNRLYQPDLAKTYFTEDDLYYERLKDYGAVFYMHVYSSNQMDNEMFSMPTAKLSDLDQEARNKKVIELYPLFEKELKDNILEYGRTVKSLKDDEVLAFNVKLTKCQGCGIPSTLEIAVGGSVLKDLASGKIDKNAGLAKLTVKKGPNQ